MKLNGPARTPVACGALGEWRSDVLERIRCSFDVELREVHSDRSSALWLDREPIRWQRGGRSGLCWSEDPSAAPDPASSVGSWRDAASELDACGLAISPGKRSLHSSVSGLAPVMWIESGRAIYFATTADSLASSVGEKLDLDWRAWSSLFVLGHPGGHRTGFAQIGQLAPYACLERRRGQTDLTFDPWPWAAIVPDDDVHRAVEEFYVSLLELVRSLGSDGVAILLSGGNDSRALLAAAHDAGVPARAITAVTDGRNAKQEVELAAAAASAAGAEHEVLPGVSPAAYERAFHERLVECDFGDLSPPWVHVLRPSLQRLDLPVLDGLALDTFGAPGGRFYAREMLDPPGGFDVPRALWRALARRGPRGLIPGRVLQPAHAKSMVRLARADFIREARSMEQSGSPLLLAFYRTRTLRGVGRPTTATIGRLARAVAPATLDRLVRPLLSVSQAAKLDSAFYRALWDRFESPTVDLPTTATRPAPPGPAARVDRSPQVGAFLARAADRSVLRQVMSEPVRTQLEAGTLAQEFTADRRIQRGLAAVAALDHFTHRYERILRPPDPGELLAQAEAGSP